MTCRALIAEDEPLLAEELRDELRSLWPELQVVDVVHDGTAALRAFEAQRPELLFLDVQMPGLDGLQLAQLVAGRAHVVFITAFDHYAVQAFDAGAVDYLLKPLSTARLARALQRVRERLHHAPADLRPTLASMVTSPVSNAVASPPAAPACAAPVPATAPAPRLRWVSVQMGREVKLIPVEEICYLRADSKYVAVVTAEREALVSVPLKDLVARLDPEVFWQVHRGTVVNVHAISSVVRSPMGGGLNLKLKQRPESLAVSASHAHLFRHL